ncbi:MAG TPA: glycoside hydrolase family 3 C-terminal domain-containing protein, partial [Chthoniobacteraceae bacterium]
KNEGNLLPLNRKDLHKLAVIGELSQQVVLGDPSYIGKAKRRTVSILEGLQEAAPDLEIVPAPNDPAKAAEAARGADAAVVCVGTTLAVEREGRDRRSLGLPGAQEALVEAVQAANPHTIVVLINGGPLTIPWIKEHTPAILVAWWSGEEQGSAVAEVIFGDVNPGGRLPYTVYASEAQVPPQDEYDISKGFTYMYLRGAPLFPFGHGLSYTAFRYDALKLSASQLAASQTMQVSLQVANTGQRAGDEVVQLYTRLTGPTKVPRPAKELRGFVRVSLAPGEKRSVTLSVPFEKLAYWDEASHGFRVEPGAYEIMLGASSEDVRLRTGFTVE